MTVFIVWNGPGPGETADSLVAVYATEELAVNAVAISPFATDYFVEPYHVIV